MNAATAHETLEIDSLRVGMFVQLDGGWMSHPFPLSNFRIASVDQITKLRSLGIERVRWNPQQSDPAVSDPAVSDPACGAATRTDGVDANGGLAGDAAPENHEPPPPPVTHREKLAAQKAALQRCERQFAEAARDCRQLTALVTSRPQEAAAQADALTRALAAKMLVDDALCIRLLTDAAGDKASVHALNVTVVSMLMGRHLGLPESDLLDLGVGAMLHDVGKLDLPEWVRQRHERFDATETRCYEEHVALGVGHARKMGLSTGATLVVAQHHEQADGGGFPMRLQAGGMTTAARIVSLVNRYDNLCNPHHAGRGLTPHESLSLLFAQGKTKFDGAILGAFIKMMGVYPAGSTVQLTDDRFAVVVGVNSARPLKPRVLVHEAMVPREEALILDLDAQAGLGIRRSIAPLQLPAAVLEYLSPRPRVAYFFESVVVEPVREASLAV